MTEETKLFDCLKSEDKTTDVEGQKYIIYSVGRTKRNCYLKNLKNGMKYVNGQGTVKQNMDDLLLRIMLNFGCGSEDNRNG